MYRADPATCKPMRSSDPRRYSIGMDGRAGTRNAMAGQSGVEPLLLLGCTLPDARTPSVRTGARPPRALQRLAGDHPTPQGGTGLRGSILAGIRHHRFDSLDVVFALAQFERTLISFDSPFDRFHYGCDNTGVLTPADPWKGPLLRPSPLCGLPRTAGVPRPRGDQHRVG